MSFTAALNPHPHPHQALHHSDARRRHVLIELLLPSLAHLSTSKAGSNTAEAVLSHVPAARMAEVTPKPRSRPPHHTHSLSLALTLAFSLSLSLSLTLCHTLTLTPTSTLTLRCTAF